MVDQEHELRTMVPMSEPELADWLARRFPDGAGPAWWLFILEVAENSVSVLSSRSTAAKRETFNAIPRFFAVGQARGEITPGQAAYWLVRFGIAASRHAPIDGIDPVLTPNSAARWALDHLPISRATAEEYDRAFDRYHDAEVAEFQADREGHLRGIATVRPDPRFVLLAEVSKVVDSLGWISPSVTDEQVRADIRDWFDWKDNR